jgi:hypothetical protein
MFNGDDTMTNLDQLKFLRDRLLSPGDINEREKDLINFMIKHFIPTIDEVRANLVKFQNRMFENDGVLCIYDSALVDTYIEATETTWSNVSAEEIRVMMLEFYERNQKEVSWYSEEKHNFFVFKAVEQAKDEGKKIVILENLS